MAKAELCVLNSKDYSKSVARIIKAKKGVIIYVAVNRPHEHLVNELGGALHVVNRAKFFTLTAFQNMLAQKLTRIRAAFS